MVKIGSVIAEIFPIWSNVTRTNVAWTNVTVTVGTYSRCSQQPSFKVWSINKSVNGGKETVPALKEKTILFSLGHGYTLNLGSTPPPGFVPGMVHVFENRYFSAQPERYCHNPNPTSTELGFDIKMTLKTTPPHNTAQQ